VPVPTIPVSKEVRLLYERERRILESEAFAPLDEV
jgi:hypothetical protein